MAANPLAIVYRQYIDTLNERRFDELGRHVHDVLTYNGPSWTLDEYQALLRSDVDTIPDLRYEVRSLVADEVQVAARLWFSCTPNGLFQGIETSGRTVQFAEHVFYEFDDLKIRHVSSLIDRDAVRRQVGRAD